MQVHKFGGASISTVERIQNLPHIISKFQKGEKVMVISALGKTTNALEKIVSLYFAGKKKDSLHALASLKSEHKDMMLQLLTHDILAQCDACLHNLFQQLENSLEQNRDTNYNEYYDQSVCFGELFSSTIVSWYLKENGIENEWVDAREVIRTNENYREAGVLWSRVRTTIKEKVLPVLKEKGFIVTQGFIGSTLAGKSTTLGREGSDFTAAIFASLLHAGSVTIWKDVGGVMNADPKQLNDARVISHLNYKEVIEMSYYGAQVIHPKTIKPLQNESIPLYVRSFLNPSAKGTIIDSGKIKSLPPMSVFKFKQALLSFQTKNYSFVEGKPARKLKNILADALVKANLTQNTAISLLVCIDDIPEKREIILNQADDFEVYSVTDLILLTIRHYTPGIIEKLTKGKQILLEQKTEDTVQILYRQ